MYKRKYSKFNRLLTGTPDLNGIWSPSLASGTSIFDPSIDVAGTYTYTVSNGACGTDSAEVEVTIDMLPNAGENGNLEICINANTVNLIDYLTGTPDLNGIWSPSLASGTSIFDPSIDVAGTYTYTVSNGACGTDSAEVEVALINVSINTDFDINITEVDLNYYNIEIDINPVSNYLYSINGIDFQLQNTFNNLIGGNYTIYANEIEGCENFVKDISLLYFPNFFTPNNDGVNDVWKVDSLINQEYSIRIFDRFGKLITILNRFNNSWDGNFNSQKLPSTDYWFVATLTEGRIYKGHLTLKR